MKLLRLSIVTLLSFNGLYAQVIPDRAGGLTEMRATAAGASPGTNKTFFVTDPGKQGIFTYDPLDKTSPDDSVMTIVTAAGFRFKRSTDQHFLNVRWFGAVGNGVADDWQSIQKAINYILNNGTVSRTLYFPPGSYKISKPLIIARISGNVYAQASITLEGPANSKDLATGAASIETAFNDGFAIGVQLGKGVLIKDLMIQGKFMVPNKLNSIQIDTLSADEWTDGVTRQDTYSPHAGVVIDPFSDPAAFPNLADLYPGLQGYYLRGMNRSGSTAVQIVGCSIHHFVVGVMITPSNQQNAELIDVIDCDLTSDKVCYAMGQAQSKECHVDRLKVWGGVHTVFDNVGYGVRHGDGANVPLVDGVNIAGSVKQLCRIRASSFGGVFRNIYAEELYRIGYVDAKATVSFEDCQINFATRLSGAPYPDFFILGSGSSFQNCALRFYTGQVGFRLLLSGSSNSYAGGMMNEPPIAASMQNYWSNPNPRFDNVVMYYSGGILGNRNPGLINMTTPIMASNGPTIDPVYPGNYYTYQDLSSNLGVLYKITYDNHYERTALIGGSAVMHVDKSKWTGWFKLSNPLDSNIVRPGDYILTTGLNYRDQFKDIKAANYPVGKVQRIEDGTVYLINLAEGIQEGMSLRCYLDYYVYGKAPFTGDMAAGSNLLTNVQGTLPIVGERPDMPMLPIGSFVTAVDKTARTIQFSNVNKTGQRFADFTIMNGYPLVEMYSSYDPAALQKFGKTLIGGANYYRYSPNDISNFGANYIVHGSVMETYKILSSNFQGDTTMHRLNFVKR